MSKSYVAKRFLVELVGDASTAATTYGNSIGGTLTTTATASLRHASATAGSIYLGCFKETSEINIVTSGTTVRVGCSSTPIPVLGPGSAGETTLTRVLRSTELVEVGATANPDYMVYDSDGNPIGSFLYFWNSLVFDTAGKYSETHSNAHLKLWMLKPSAPIVQLDQYGQLSGYDVKTNSIGIIYLTNCQAGTYTAPDLNANTSDEASEQLVVRYTAVYFLKPDTVSFPAG